MKKRIKKEKIEVLPKVIDPTPLPDNEEMERLDKKHYEKQMEIVIRLYGYKEKGLTFEEAARKIGLAPSYLQDVYDHDVVYMQKLWAKLFNIKEGE